MRSVQLGAPPNAAEHAAMEAQPKVKRAVSTWCEVDGWCSACRERPVTVAHMGTENFNFALCRKCIDALDATFDEHAKKLEEEAEGFAPRQMARVRAPR